MAGGGGIIAARCIVAGLIVLLATIYLWIGLAIGIVFLLLGIERVHPATGGAYAFRPLLLPGLVLLWPYVLRRWVAAGFY